MIRITRHAKNNMRLYKITIADIEEVLEESEIRDREGYRYIALKRIKKKFENMPLKVVYMIEKEDKIIITAYPLRRTYKKG